MRRRGIFIGIAAGVILMIMTGKSLIDTVAGSCVGHDAVVFVPKGSTYQALLDSLENSGAMENISRFERMARLKSLDSNIRGGCYRLKAGMSASHLVNMFLSGAQSPVRLTINNVRTMEQLASKFSAQIEADSVTLLQYLTSDTVSAKYGFTDEEFIGMFIPNTYEVWWTVSPADLLDRMKKEYDRFWTDERKGKLERTRLTQKQVSVLASIVTQETNMSDEMPLVASVYINRLRRGMLLQADPTVKFAMKDFALKRILHRHLAVDSPYNTYKYAGLPPAPICMPSIKALDAVLNYKQTDYLYFCARDDFSGYHNFARTLSEHNANARRYSAALNKAGIR